MVNENEHNGFSGATAISGQPASFAEKYEGVEHNVWRNLKNFTDARIALGRAGNSLPTQEILAFDMAHAMARDAVHIPLNAARLIDAMHQREWQTRCVNSRVIDRHSYLLRPDLGRRLSDESCENLRNNKPASAIDFLIVVGDGLSSAAISNHAVALIEKIKSYFPAQWTMGPIVCATQARVAIADEIASIWQVPMVAFLIGERPGLSSPDSLGIYFTWNPSLQSTDADRNCISNIRPQGLSYEVAAKKLIWLATQAKILGYSGVQLKDESDIPIVDSSKKLMDNKF